MKDFLIGSITLKGRGPVVNSDVLIAFESSAGTTQDPSCANSTITRLDNPSRARERSLKLNVRPLRQTCRRISHTLSQELVDF